ncbi:Histidine transporter, periplasmic histidine-binding protein [Pseudomonas sp. FEN]|nr:Histidine transporter, periplasmic histidine-binding protein [Pseudomonas sp. FEN]
MPGVGSGDSTAGRTPSGPAGLRGASHPTLDIEIVNQQKLKAYGLTDSYVNFRSGSGAALDAEITSSIRRGKPILFYYWSPTPCWASSSWSSSRSRL